MTPGKKLFVEALDSFPQATHELLGKAIEDGGFLDENVVKELMKELGIQDTGLLLIKLLPCAAAYARASISGFKVGAVAQGEGNPGSFYFGANLEFPRQALTFTVHAEQSAVINAWQHGEPGLQKLAISTAPCGYCCQFIYEIVNAKEIGILFKTGTSDQPTPRVITDHLPIAFGPLDLDNPGGLMQPGEHDLTIGESPDELASAALLAANHCYAPYTLDYSGIAIRGSDDRVYTGRYAENAAFNPSISPLEAALSFMNMNHNLANPIVIEDVVLVETEPKKISQLEATEGLLSKITDVPLRYYRAEPQKEV